jgi:hypothetical protein
MTVLDHYLVSSASAASVALAGILGVLGLRVGGVPVGEVGLSAEGLKVAAPAFPASAPFGSVRGSCPASLCHGCVCGLAI